MGVTEWCSITRRFVDETPGTFVDGEILSQPERCLQELAADGDGTSFRRSLQSDFAEAEHIRDERLATAVGRRQANGMLRADFDVLDVLDLLEPLAKLAVITVEYDETYVRQRDPSIEIVARGLAPPIGRDSMRGVPTGTEGRGRYFRTGRINRVA